MSRKDIFSKKRRSEIMSSIRSKNTKIELLLKDELKKQGLNFGMHAKLPGSPDFVFCKKKLAVFCHGDFWHGKNYDRMKPKLNRYWRNKIELNMKRDARVRRILNKQGWRILTLKGSQISRDVIHCVGRIRQKLMQIPA